MITVVILLVIVAGLGAAIAVLVSTASRARAGQGIGASFGAILVAYFYAMSVVSLVVLAIGMTSLVKTGLTVPFGVSFSYYLPPIVAPPVQPAPPRGAEGNQQQTAQVEQQSRSDLVQGGTLAVSGAIVWALHTLGRRGIVRATDTWTTFLARAHLVVLLLLFGLVGLISLALGAYQSLLFAVTPVDAFASRQPPGEAAAMAIVFVPGWLIVLGLALGELRRERQ